MGSSGISISLYGDGAASQGQLYEAYNLSKLWNLPAIFVCENNEYGMGTSTDRHSASTEFYKRAGYLPGMLVDGMDVLAVREATKFAKEYVLKNGPIMIELKTYRYHGHSMSDPGTSYRTRDEVQAIKKKVDPITSFRQKCLDAGLLTTDQVKAIDKEVKNILRRRLKRHSHHRSPQWRRLPIISPRQVCHTRSTPVTNTPLTLIMPICK